MGNSAWSSAARRTVSAGAAGIVGLTALIMSASTSLAAHYSEWFRYGDEAAQSWQFSEVDGDPNRVEIRRKNSGDKEPEQHVMVLYPKPSSAYAVAITKILEVFANKNIDTRITVVNFAKDDARGSAALSLADEIGSDLIFSMGSASTAWLWKNYKDGAIPVVSVCSKDPVVLGQIDSYDSSTGTNFAFTSLNMPIEVQMAYVLELKPDLKNLGVLVDSQNVSAVQTQAEPIAAFARARGIRVLDLAVQAPEDAKAELPKLVADAVATMRKNDPTLNSSLLWITGSTSVFREIGTINAHSDRVPVLSVVPEVVQAGDASAVMSIGVSFQSNAHLAAIYGIDVLQGRAEAGDLKVGIVSPPDIAINFRKAREIALDVPFSFLESASFVYDYEGRLVRENGKAITPSN